MTYSARKVAKAQITMGFFSSTLNTCVDIFVNILTWNIEGLHKYQDNLDLKIYFTGGIMLYF